MKPVSNSNIRLARRSLLRGVIGVTAATSFPARWSRAADAPNEAIGSMGEKVILSGADLEDLQRSIAGPVILPSSLDYDQERRL